MSKGKELQEDAYYSLRDVKAKFFPSRSERWIKDKAKEGEFGEVALDGGGWLIPLSGIVDYLNRHRLTATTKAGGRSGNLVQFKGGQ